MKTSKILALGIAAVVAAASGSALADDGEKAYNKHCKKCHIMKDKHGVGPSLIGVFGKQAGTSSFKKYKALKGSDIVWDETNLDAWIADPRKFIKEKPQKLRQQIHGYDGQSEKAEERKAIIEYLKAN